MNEIGREYADALFSLAVQEDKADEYSEVMKEISRTFAENPAYLDFLSSPGIPAKERTAALEDAFSSFCPEYVLSFVQLLCEKGHIRAFEECRHEFDTMRRAASNLSVAHVTSAVELTTDERERLKTRLEKQFGHEVILSCRVDESILGGIIVRIDDRLLDGSLLRRLHDVKEVIEQ